MALSPPAPRCEEAIYTRDAVNDAQKTEGIKVDDGAVAPNKASKLMGKMGMWKLTKERIVNQSKSSPVKSRRGF